MKLNRWETVAVVGEGELATVLHESLREKEVGQVTRSRGEDNTEQPVWRGLPTWLL